MTVERPPVQPADRHIRRILRINAAIVAIAGLALIVLGAPLAARMGWMTFPVGGLTGATALRGFGIALLPLAALALFTSLYRPFLRPLGWFFAGVDIVWGILWWVILAFGVPLGAPATTFAIILLAGQATLVFAIGLYEWWAMRQLRSA